MRTSGSVQPAASLWRLNELSAAAGSSGATTAAGAVADPVGFSGSLKADVRTNDAGSY